MSVVLERFSNLTWFVIAIDKYNRFELIVSVDCRLCHLIYIYNFRFVHFVLSIFILYELSYAFNEKINSRTERQEINNWILHTEFNNDNININKTKKKCDRYIEN